MKTCLAIALASFYRTTTINRVYQMADMIDGDENAICKMQ
jgi:hypothetical protein